MPLQSRHPGYMNIDFGHSFNRKTDKLRYRGVLGKAVRNLVSSMSTRDAPWGWIYGVVELLSGELQGELLDFGAAKDRKYVM